MGLLRPCLRQPRRLGEVVDSAEVAFALGQQLRDEARADQGDGQKRDGREAVAGERRVAGARRVAGGAPAASNIRWSDQVRSIAGGRRTWRAHRGRSVAPASTHTADARRSSEREHELKRACRGRLGGGASQRGFSRVSYGEAGRARRRRPHTVRRAERKARFHSPRGHGVPESASEWRADDLHTSVRRRLGRSTRCVTHSPRARSRRRAHAACRAPLPRLPL